MKIAMVSEHVSPLEPPGGPAGGEQSVHVGELAAALAGQGHAVTVYTRRSDPAADATVVHESGYRLECLSAGAAEPLPVEGHLPHLPEFARHLREHLQADQPELVHGHSWTSGMVSLAATKYIGVPVVQTFHSLGVCNRPDSGLQTVGPPGRAQMERVIGGSAEHSIATSTAQMNDLVRLGVARGRVTVVPCGVDLELFQPGPPPATDRPPRLVSLGRLVAEHGFDLQIRALRRVPGAELYIGGAGVAADLDSDPEAVRLRGLAEQLGVADRVHLVGRVDRADVPDLLRSARLILATPTCESFGLVALEAMACGMPVLASAVGGHLDTVVDGVTGVLLPPGRADLLAVAINRLLDDPVQLDAFGVAGADRASSRYSWERIAADTTRVYQAVLGTPPEEPPEPAAEDEIAEDASSLAEYSR